jgi:hypothetical protein
MIATKNAWSKKCQINCQKLSQSVKKLLLSCQKNVQEYGQKMVKSCQKVVKKLSKSCQKLSKSCQKVSNKAPGKNNCTWPVRNDFVRVSPMRPKATFEFHFGDGMRNIGCKRD